MVFIVYKQKTAYEMRISDWSSDVCSSDLSAERARLLSPSITPLLPRRSASRARSPFSTWAASRISHSSAAIKKSSHLIPGRAMGCSILPSKNEVLGDMMMAERWPRAERRSEEHTSELQSLMRISYAVFCLKKKKKTNKK